MTASARALYPAAPLVDENGNLNPAWQQVFTLWGLFVTAGKQSGATADRPTQGLWVGRSFYDLSLGKPIWVHSVSPLMWHDAAGNLV